MALRTPEFSYPQPIQSPIYQAFQLGLQHLVELPFQIGAENRATKRQIAAEGRSLEQSKKLAEYTNRLGIQGQETVAQYTEGLRDQSDIEDNYVEATDANRAQLVAAGMDPANLYRAYNGKQFLPKSALAQASQLNAPVDTGTTNLISGTLAGLRKRGIITGPPLPAEQAIAGGQPLTARQLTQTLEAVNPSLAIAGLDQNERLRQMEMELARRNRQDLNDTRIFSLLRESDPTKTLGLGVRELDANGQPTGRVRPMTAAERVGFQNDYLDVIADNMKQNGEPVPPSIQRYIDARAMVDRAGVAALPYLKGQDLEQETARIGSDANSDEMQSLAYEGMHEGIIVGTDGSIPNDWVSAAAILKSDPKMLRALIASHYYKSGAPDVLSSQSLPGAYQFDPQELGYLNNIFARTGRQTFEGGTPAGTPTNPSSFGGGAPPTQKPGGIFTLPVSPEQGGPTQFFSPFSSAPPTRSLTNPSDYQDYNNVVAIVGTRLKQDPSLYPQMKAWVDSSLSTPEAAVQFFRTHGFDQNFYQGLTTGTPAQRQAAWRTRRNTLLWALEDAYHSATESPNNTVLPNQK